MNKRRVGESKEKEAAAYLQAQGMQILEYNFRSRRGEIDLIGKQDEYLVFVEVKFRQSKAKGSPLEAVDLRKQRQICKVADFYRLMHGIGEFAPIRYDVVGIEGDKITWIPNAFQHIYGR
ncbi:MAG: YraN family protein [Lachnospiraceae bacterium]|nr:YraN family protein [Lachnospiraceae bacterium]